MRARVVGGEREDREWRIYSTILKDVRSYLATRMVDMATYLPIPQHFKVVCSETAEDVEEEEEEEEEVGEMTNKGDKEDKEQADSVLSAQEEKLDWDTKEDVIGKGEQVQKKVNEEDENEEEKHECEVFLLENMNYRGYSEDVLKDREGLDYEHSVLALATLARFHAASYCYRREKGVSPQSLYGHLLNQHLTQPQVSQDTLLRLEEIFRQQPEFRQYSGLFMEPARGKDLQLGSGLDRFGVLCHGNFWRENLRFKYKNPLESRLFCREVVFLDLGNSHFGSCVLDILQFVFTSIEKDIRTNFLADFVCSVYYDSFVKAVGCINNDLPVFSRRSLIKEFEKKIMYGFLLNLSIQSQMYEEGLQKVQERGHAPSYVGYKDSILGVVR